jgi:hypothetical protein
MLAPNTVFSWKDQYKVCLAQDNADPIVKVSGYSRNGPLASRQTIQSPIFQI